MGYYVINGEVHSGPDVYVKDDLLPECIGDEAMVEAGAIEWRGDEDEVSVTSYNDLTKKELLALCDERGIEVNGRPNNDAIIDMLEADDADKADDESEDEDQGGD